MSVTEESIDWLEELVYPAIDQFYKEDNSLVLMNLDAHERTIVANIYCKMNVMLNKIKEKNTNFMHLNIDVEYNRNNEDTKRASRKCRECTKCNCISKKYLLGCKSILPDIILHERQTNKDNQVAIEFKKDTNTNVYSREKDMAKLSYLTCSLPSDEDDICDYKYRLGCFIELCKDSYEVTIFENAEPKPVKKRKRGKWF